MNDKNIHVVNAIIVNDETDEIFAICRRCNKKFILDKQCLKRQLKPDDVASLVVHLSSDVSSGCTKQNFIIDAGIT